MSNTIIDIRISDDKTIVDNNEKVIYECILQVSGGKNRNGHCYPKSSLLKEIKCINSKGPLSACNISFEDD